MKYISEKIPVQTYRLQTVKISKSLKLLHINLWNAEQFITRLTNSKLPFLFLKDYCDKSSKITFMSQESELQNSLNQMQLCYKDHLPLMENGNIKFSKSAIKTLRDVLSLSSPLIKSSPPSSSLRSNLPSVQTFSQPSSLQSLLATATPFSPKYQNFLVFASQQDNFQSYVIY